jgi:peptidoglycan/LPS O-acetylase OafA/YrhL
MPQLHPSYRPDIDGLRAIAVLLVLFHHAFPLMLPSGFIGVDLFFVISGFLITTIIFQNLENGKFSFLDFYVRRINRIFPALILVLAACLVYGWFSLLPADYKQLGKHTVAGATFLSNFAFWYESGYFDGDSKLKPLLHLWSLGVEEQYYIFWPLIAWLAWKRKVNLLILCLALLAASFVANLAIVQSNPVAAFFSPVSRSWELLIGSILAYVKLHTKNKKENENTDHATRNNLSAWLGVCLLAIGVVFINPERLYPGFWAMLPELTAYLLISAGPHAWLNRVVLSNRLFRWIGLISFPLYLWHWPLLVFAKQSSAQQPSFQLILLMVAISVALAWLTYLLVEGPIRFGKGNGRRKAIFLSLLMIVIAYTGFNIYKRDGLSFRMPPALQKIAAFSNDYDKDSNFECMIGMGDSTSENPRECFRSIGNGNKSILLWGDSYAWAMYAGINKVAAPKANVYLMSKASCPPLLADELFKESNCNAQNARVIDIIKNEKYDQVVLIARWDQWKYQSDQYIPNISKTIDHLKLMGVKQIYVIGPPPEWHPGLQVVLVKQALRDKLTHKLADRISEGVTTSPELDQQLQQLAQEKKISYISLLNILCNQDGCITKAGNEPEDLIGYDDGHFSRKGGAFVAKQFPADFFE